MGIGGAVATATPTTIGPITVRASAFGSASEGSAPRGLLLLVAPLGRHGSAVGANVCFGSVADSRAALAKVRFEPNSGHITRTRKFTGELCALSVWWPRQDSNSKGQGFSYEKVVALHW